jgi:hypothetical protein
VSHSRCWAAPRSTTTRPPPPPPPPPAPESGGGPERTPWEWTCGWAPLWAPAVTVSRWAASPWVCVPVKYTQPHTPSTVWVEGSCGDCCGGGLADCTLRQMCVSRREERARCRRLESCQPGWPLTSGVGWGYKIQARFLASPSSRRRALLAVEPRSEGVGAFRRFRAKRRCENLPTK